VAVVKNFLHADATGAGRQACRLLTPQAQTQIVSEMPGGGRHLLPNCVKQLSRPKPALRHVRIHQITSLARGQAVTVAYGHRTRATFTVVEQNGQWKIQSVPGSGG